MIAPLTISSLDLDLIDRGCRRRVLRNLSLTVGKGEIVGLVGESGSGKSVSALAALGLLPADAFEMSAGRLELLGRDVRKYSRREMEDLRGKRVSMVFQEPSRALNPILRIDRQMTEVLRRHSSLTAGQARERAGGLLEEMMVGDPDRVLGSLPHALSGGLRQRVLLAMALSANVDLLIADEPTTALDVTIQAQVIALIRARARERDMAVLFISHDLGLVRWLCDRVYVMYAGAVVEAGDVLDVLDRSSHPYTSALLGAMPTPERLKGQLAAIPGAMPGPGHVSSGCAFAARCARRIALCSDEPRVEDVGTVARHQVACWRAGEGVH